MSASGWNITAPFLGAADATQAVAEGGLSGGADPGNTARGLLLGLQRLPTMYGGTVPEHVVARRRRRNKAAKESRRRNR